MSELGVSSKPTLGLLLSNPEADDMLPVSQEKIRFPKINTKLKKSHFTKYHSSFISAKNYDLQQKSEENGILSYESFMNKVKESPARKKSENRLEKIKHEINDKVWKINQKHNKSYSVRSPEKLNKSRILFQEELEELEQTNKILNERLTEEDDFSQKPKFALLTEIIDLNISPIHHSETQREKQKYLKKSDEINESIQRSNHIIFLIEKNYQKGFFSDTKANEDKKFDQLEEKLGLFAYLKRDFVTKKETLSPEKVVEYFKRPSNRKLEAKVNLEAREFLKEKLHNDYRSHNEVNKFRGDLSQRAIEECKIFFIKEIKGKNVAFHKEYRKKYNIPYFSFLSLPKHLKVKVLENMTKEPKEKGNK